MADRKKVHIITGGTIYHVRPHLALCAPAFGRTGIHRMDLQNSVASMPYT